MDFDFLTPGGVKIKQSPGGYRFTSDAVALAEFARCRSEDIVIDAGCGGGVISLIINDRCKPRKIIAVDIQPQAVELTRENIALNNITNIEALDADIRELHRYPCHSERSEKSRQFTSLANYSNKFDVFICNPPYFSSGCKSQNPQRASARHDGTLSLQDLVNAATKLLKYSGSLYMCYPAAHTAKAIHILESHNFRVKQLKFLQNKKEIYLVLIHARKGGGDCTKICVSGSS